VVFGKAPSLGLASGSFFHQGTEVLSANLLTIPSWGRVEWTTNSEMKRVGYRVQGGAFEVDFEKAARLEKGNDLWGKVYS